MPAIKNQNDSTQLFWIIRVGFPWYLNLRYMYDMTNMREAASSNWTWGSQIYHIDKWVVQNIR